VIRAYGASAEPDACARAWEECLFQRLSDDKLKEVAGLPVEGGILQSTLAKIAAERQRRKKRGRKRARDAEPELVPWFNPRNFYRDDV